MARYLDDRLDGTEKQEVEDHLSQCSQCREQVRSADQLAEAYGREGQKWWSQYVGHQVMTLVAKVPEAAEQLKAAIHAPTPFVKPSGTPVCLPLLEPSQRATQPLAADTGEGFSEQRIHQHQPPFEFHLVQVGDELHFSARTSNEDSPYENCLARLQLIEAGVTRLSRIILIEQGEGQCTIEPNEAATLRPGLEPLTIQLMPMLTLQQIEEAEAEAYRPILTKLLKHEDPPIRRYAAEVLVRIMGSSARPLVKPLAEDDDENVRKAVARALAQMDGQI